MTTFQLCDTCGSPLNQDSNCDTPGCGQPGIPYEVWQRTITDTLWQEKWELSHVKPTPPLQQWYKEGKDPAAAAAYILAHHKLITKKPKKKPSGTRRTPAAMSEKTTDKYPKPGKYPRLAKLPKNE